MPDHDPQMLKGALSLLLLQLLSTQEDYGYSIVVRLQDLGFGDLSEGTVYPALTRLESQGLLAAHLVRSTSGPARKYYRPTAAGHAEMARAGRMWHHLVAAVAQIVPPPQTPSPPQATPAPQHHPAPRTTPAPHTTPVAETTPAPETVERALP